MSAAIKSGTGILSLPPEALTKEYIASHKKEYVDMVSALVIGLIEDAYGQSEAEQRDDVVCQRLRVAMKELQPALNVARKLTKEDISTYAEWTKNIKEKLKMEQPATHKVIADPKIQKLSNCKADHFILAHLIRFTKSTQ